MAQTVEAIYENGMLRPIHPLAGIADRCKVRITVVPAEESPHPLADCIGILPREDADEMLRAIKDDFEKVDLDAWR